MRRRISTISSRLRMGWDGGADWDYRFYLKKKSSWIGDSSGAGGGTFADLGRETLIQRPVDCATAWRADALLTEVVRFSGVLDQY